MASERTVRYEKAMRDAAKLHGKFLVTIEVYGHHIGDDSCCVQFAADTEKARELARLALKEIKKARPPRKGTGRVVSDRI